MLPLLRGTAEGIFSSARKADARQVRRMLRTPPLEFFHRKPRSGDAKPLVGKLNGRGHNGSLQAVVRQLAAFARTAVWNRTRHASVMELPKRGSCVLHSVLWERNSPACAQFIGPGLSQWPLATVRFATSPARSSVRRMRKNWTVVQHPGIPAVLPARAEEHRPDRDQDNCTPGAPLVL